MAMEKPEWLERSVGAVQGERMVCQYVHRVDSRGFWLGSHIFNYTFPILMAEITVIFVVSWSTYFLLRPLRQTMIITQIVAGIIMGPLIVARYSGFIEMIFPPGSRVILSTYGELGLMIHLFVLGVQIDPSQLKSIGRKATVIGLSGLMLAFAFGALAYRFIDLITPSDRKLGPGVSIVLAVNSVTSFPVITNLLRDLNILNSQIGRLACPTSMVSDACGWFLTLIISNVVRALRNSTFQPMLTVGVVFGYYGTLFFVLRPLVIWILSHNADRSNIKETHSIAIFCLVLLNGLLAEYVGQHSAFGTFVFGLSLPDGPPLGDVLLQKLGIVGSGFLFPIYCTISGLRTNIPSLEWWSASIELVIVVGYVGKFIGTLLPSLYFGIPFQDSLSLALIMCCRGVMELAIYSLWMDIKIIDREIFTLLIISMVLMTGFATPIIRYLYDPSRRYTPYMGRTILNSRQHHGLRILVCIHNEDNVLPIINFLEASNPSKENFISVLVLHLKDLTGRAAAILIRHNKSNNSACKLASSEHIVNAFNQYEQYSHGRVVVEHFTAFAPYASMHDDICNIAMDERSNIIIVPFHKKWATDGSVEACFPSIRMINRYVVQKAPCSVGVLIDRSQINGKQSVMTVKSYRVAMFFLGGADDQEALEYSIRMARHKSISLTVVWFKAKGHQTYSNQKIPEYTQVLNESGVSSLDMEKITRKEEIVQDGADTTYVIRMMEEAFDLVIVGNHHEPDSPATLGLTEWSECPELGILGDMLASSDFPFSVLVMHAARGPEYSIHVK